MTKCNVTHLDVGDVPWSLDSVEGGGVDTTGFHPQGLVCVGVFGVDLLDDLPGQVVHGLQRRGEASFSGRTLLNVSTFRLQRLLQHVSVGELVWFWLHLEMLCQT